MGLGSGLLVGVVGGLVVGYLLAAYRGFDPGTGVTDWGRFTAEPVAAFLDDGRTVRLKEDFAYVDRGGKTWIAPKDTVVDGASIPAVFWSAVGGPFEGQYRNASIVHDIECDRMKEPWEKVHRMFYEACRCGGVAEDRAALLYGAVYHFGPKWVIRPVHQVIEIEGPDGRSATRTITTYVGERTFEAPPGDPEAAQRKLLEYIERNRPTPEQIEQIDLGAL